MRTEFCAKRSGHGGGTNDAAGHEGVILLLVLASLVISACTQPSPATPSPGAGVSEAQETRLPGKVATPLSRNHAIDRALEVLSRPRPEVTGVENPRNPVARRMTLGEFEEHFADDRYRKDPSIPVWVVQVEGRSQPAGILPDDTIQEYDYAVAVLDARHGDLLSTRHISTPIFSVRPPPFEGMDNRVYYSDLSVVGRVSQVSEGQRGISPNGQFQVDYYTATVQVERTVFGPEYDRVTVYVPFHTALAPEPMPESGQGSMPTKAPRELMPESRQGSMPTKAPNLAEGEHVLLFLSQASNYFDLAEGEYVTTGGGVLWGKLAVEDGEVIQRLREAPPEPLEEVIVWIEETHALLEGVKPGVLIGAITGLPPGEAATIKVERYEEGQEPGGGEATTTVKFGNGGWKAGPRLLPGPYVVVPQSEGYLSVPKAIHIQVPEKGVAWRYISLDFELFRPEDAEGRFGMPLCGEPKEASSSPAATASPPPLGPDAPFNVCFGEHTGIGWLVPRGIKGTVSGLAERAAATVQVRRLSDVEGDCYYRAGPEARLSDCTYPEEVIPLDDLGGLDPGKTLVWLTAKNGRWGLVDPSLGGGRYLVTVEHGYVAEPAAYVVVVYGGKVPHVAMGVDFRLWRTHSTVAPPARKRLNVEVSIPGR